MYLPNEMYYVYILESEIKPILYIGSSKDFNERLKQHNSGYSKSTKHGVPWKLIHTEEYPTRKEAMQREKYLKSLKNPMYLKEKIIEWRASR